MDKPNHPTIIVLLQLLRERLATDFSGDQLPAIYHCVRHRQQINGCLSAKDYLCLVQATPMELEVLAQDVLASVSPFSPDPDALRLLGAYLDRSGKLNKPGGDIRIWVPGCAFGEEAYSVAMLLAETLPEIQRYHIQIYATDPDEGALSIARRGIFTAPSVQNIPPLLRDRYFVAVGSAFEAVKTLRDMIVFTRHNLELDPPFLRLDLIYYRKKLFDRDSAQQLKLLQKFHFSLLPGGLLFLGSKLAPTNADPLFVEAEQGKNIYVSASKNVERSLRVERVISETKEIKAIAASELQITNDLLKVMNEELKAANQDLQGLNEEINNKTSALASLNQEYRNLYDALDFPLLVFDNHQRLIRFNLAAQQRLNLRESSISTPLDQLDLGDLKPRIECLTASVMARQARDDVVFEEEDCVFRLGVTPGFSSGGEISTLIVSCFDVTDVSRANARLKQSEAKLSALMERTSVIFAMKDLHGRYLYANRKFLDFFNVRDTEIIGHTDFEVMPNAMAADMWSHDLEALRRHTPVTFEHEFKQLNDVLTLRSTHHVIWGEGGIPTAFLFEAVDITANRHAENQLRITAKIFDRAGEAILVSDANGIIQAANTEFCAITGYRFGELSQQPISCLRSGRNSEDFYEQIWKTLQDNGFWQGEIWVQHKNGAPLVRWLTVSGIHAETGEIENFVAVLADIERIHDSRRKAEYLATHDPLTGLPNRALFQDRLRHSLSRVRRTKGSLALLFIDLDNFKTINDTLGHDVGDRLLKMAADRLLNVVRDVDTVARLGGDEFTAILTDCSVSMVAQVARRIVDDIASSFVIDQRSLFVSASIGVAMCPEDGEDSTSLIKAADAAMYRAKELGRNRVEFFESDLQVRLYKKAAIESGIREAVKHQRFRLVFQPQYSMEDTSLVVGAEVLLRWHDPVLGQVMPAEFIAVAEAGGLINDVTRSLHGMLFAQLKHWLDAGLQVPQLAINVSPRCMREAGFAQGVIDEMNVHGVVCDRIMVEITESALLENTSVCADNIEMMMKCGIKISIDDFGTGYSSLGYLKRLRLGELKIDKSFVDGLGENADDEAIACAVLALAKALNIRTVAEGVQTRTQHEWLKEHGCEIGQGFLYARPLELAEFEDCLKVWTERA